jgi:Ribbon-helix-helix protein
MKNTAVVRLEERTARLTILIDPRKKVLFERLCAEEDLTSSQVVRRMIRAYVEERLGRPWIPGEEDPISEGPVARGGANKRRTSRT